MDDFVPVPRRLRARTTVLLGQTRVPARAVGVCIAFGVAGVVLMIGGASLMRTLSILLPALVVVLALTEARWAGRPLRRVLLLLCRHAARPKHVRLLRAPIVVATRPDTLSRRHARWITPPGPQS